MMATYEPLAEAMVKVQETEGKDEEVMTAFNEHWSRYMDFSWASQWDGKKYDVVFYGMHGYSGYLIMEYLKRNTLKKMKKDQFSFAFAGRTANKVAEMVDREFAGTDYQDTPILSASFDNPMSIVDLVKSARVVVNVGGPYMLTEGDVLIDACIWCKTDYVDVSQELPWSLRTKELHNYAREAGVIVVPGAASNAYTDLGVYLLAKKIREEYGEMTRSAVCYTQGGGTAAGVAGNTLRTRAVLSGVDKATAQQMADPFSLGGFIPNVDRNGVKLVDIQLGTGAVTVKSRDEDADILMTKISEDKKYGVWRAPHEHSFLDTRIVRRSNMLNADLGDMPYGTSLNFMEYALLPPDNVAAAKSAARENKDEAAKPMGLYGMTLEEEEAMMRSEGKDFDEDEGPDLADMGDAWTGYFLAAESMTGNGVKCSFVGADGYYESSRIAVETALALRFDREKLQYKGGVLTPSTAGGTVLVDRLISSGVKFKMGEWMESGDLAPPSIDKA